MWSASVGRLFSLSNANYHVPFPMALDYVSATFVRYRSAAGGICDDHQLAKCELAGAGDLAN